MTPRKPIKIGDIVCCRSPDGLHELPVGLPNNARAKVVATYIGATYVYFEGVNYIVPNACVHPGSDDFGTLPLAVTQSSPTPPEAAKPDGPCPPIQP